MDARSFVSSPSAAVELRAGAYSGNMGRIRRFLPKIWLMHRIIFYSWQSDLPNRTNRSFIQQALENVTKGIRSDDSVDVEPVVDRDTQGVPGSPDIAKTIFQKIASADIVVADVSFINPSQQGRRTPNPNILLELGYALHALGDERVILVFNTAYGTLEGLPFDLRMRRVMPFSMPETGQERSSERRALESKLDEAIRVALGSIKPAPSVSLLSEALESVEKLAPNRVLVVRRLWAEIQGRIQATRPKSVSEGATTQDLLDAIAATLDVAVDYTRLAATIATMADWEAATTLHRGFGPILEAYDLPNGFSGTFYPADFDFMKFVGHELYTTLFACLVREGRWELISHLLAQGIPVKFSRREHGPANCGFDHISEHLESFSQLNREKQRLCVHADVLKARHEQAPLGILMPFEDFIAADYFLFLRGELSTDDPQTFLAWRPWSSVFMKHTPHFLIEARHGATAQKIAVALGVPDVEALKRKLGEHVGRLSGMWRSGWWDQPVSAIDIDRIATS
jgi:hypothetical protein